MNRTAPPGPRSAVQACVPLAAMVLAACASITHADEFSLAEQKPDVRLCAACPARPDLRHPPCGPAAASPGEDRVVVFAMRALDLGVRASGWHSDYNVGLDQDCSDRPDGLPASCAPRSTKGWTALGDGVDNALASQVFYPLVEHLLAIDQRFDVQAQINKSLESGVGNALLVVDGWNGLADDQHVGVRLVSAKGVVNDDGRTQPSWSGDDEWEVYADRWDAEFPGQGVPDAPAKSKNGYVTGGVLVWDARDIQPFQARFTVGQATVEIDLANVVVFGEIASFDQPRKLINAALGGVWSAFLASRKAEALAQIATQCDPCAAKAVAPTVEQLLQVAPDMLLPTSNAPGACDAISVGFLGSYVEARAITRLTPSSAMPASCPDAPPCSR